MQINLTECNKSNFYGCNVSSSKSVEISFIELSSYWVSGDVWYTMVDVHVQ